MKPSTKNRAKEKFHEVKGKVKEKVAHAVDDQRRESEGRREKEAGTIQREIGEPEDIDAGEAPLSYARRQ